jgi:predicted outer membrane protein
MNRFPIASRLALSAAGLLFVAVTATAQTAQPAPAAPSASSPSATRLHEADQAFINDGTKAVSTQRDAARIANSRSSDSQVKAFAERVVSDDEKISQAMRAASPRGIDVPHNDPDAAVLGSIKNLRGADFDKAYLEQVALTGEQKTMSVFQAEIASGRDTKLKEVARQALPMLQAHYAEAQKLAQRHHLDAQ